MSGTNADDQTGDEVACFLPGTLILTDKGEVQVQELRVGDSIVTLGGQCRRLCWIGHGRTLAKRGRRSAATPVIVRKGAFADNVPHRDLRVTKGHSFYIDNVLIPAEHLVNHRSILWDDLAREVEGYHLELDAHDVLLANGAPAESYRDDENLGMFGNAGTRPVREAIPPCAPVLTGGPVVDAVWRRLLDRCGPRRALPMTDDADLHLLVDGKRVEADKGSPTVFSLAAAPQSIRIVSRAVVPQEIGFARDSRCLGVALRSISVRQSDEIRLAMAHDDRLTLGFHGYEADNDFIWTDGYAELPTDLFTGFDGPIRIVLSVGGTTHYVDEGISVLAA